jgi:thioredoxin reductase
MTDRKNGTLFERAAREAVPAPPRAGRGRSVEATTDVRRGRAIAAAAGSACALTAVVALAAPPAGGFSPGRAITPPHAQAGLQCKSCHGETGEGTAEFRAAGRGACVGCHGPHTSTRSGHARLAASGQLGCTTCHAIHTPLQGGVSFDPDGQAHRYMTGIDVKVPGVVHATGRKVRVPAVPLAICGTCHDPWNPKDATARCADGSGFSACFDEHQAALPPDASDVAPANRGRGDPRRGALGPRGTSGAFGAPGAVCAAQHQADRAFSQDAAREVIRRLPDPRGDLRASLSGAGAPAVWLGAGGAGAMVGWAAVAAADALRTRRRKRAGAASQGDAVAPAIDTRKRLPTVDTSTCLGCYACVDACPYGVLEVERYVAVVARPEACCGLVLCEQRCPNGSLRVTVGEPDEDRLRLAPSGESLDVPGLFLAGDVTGVPLIKNAIAQGTRVAEAVARSLESAPADPRAVDVAIIGAGPAGLAAALRIQELGRTFTIVDQGTVAHAIRSFPRDKLVFDQPLELPVVGKLWLRESTKEELLGHWLRLVRREGLEVHEHQRLTGIERQGAAFRLDLVPGDGSALDRVPSIRARHVVVAIGRRGTPRKLDVEIPSELEGDVYYHLADARSFEGKRIVVIGLGDVAMENAMALARQPGTSVTIVHRGATYTRGQKRNIDAVERLRRGGRLDVILEAEVASLRTSRRGARGVATVKTPKGERDLLFDACFVLVGSIPPRDLLARLGLHRALGEARTSAPEGFDVFAAARPAASESSRA